MSRSRLLPAVLVAAVALSACGSSDHRARTGTNAARGSGTSSTSQISTAQAAAAQHATDENIAARAKNELILDGFSEGSLSQLAYRDYQAQGGTDVVSIENDSAPTAFDNLCRGSVDVVDSATPISGAALRRCHVDGVTPVQLQVGSDALVLATENETDVGADCLTLAQVKTIFKAGSPVENWDQLGFDNVPLSVAGPNPANSYFSFFGFSLVGAALPTVQDFRFDYHAMASEDGIRNYVVGKLQQGQLASAALPAALGQITSLNALIAGWKATLRGANAYVTSATQQNNATAIVLATAKRDRALAALSTLGRERRSLRAQVARDRGAERVAETVLGRLGVFQYGYYTLYEEQLRPLEITRTASRENCVFPSVDTITSGDYPLSRQLLLTVSLQELRTNPGLRAFLLSYLRNANTLTTNQVLVPLPTNVLHQEERWLAGTNGTTTTATTTTVPASGAVNSMSGAGGGEAGSGLNTTTSSAATGSSGAGPGPAASSIIPQGVH